MRKIKDAADLIAAITLIITLCAVITFQIIQLLSDSKQKFNYFISREKKGGELVVNQSISATKCLNLLNKHKKEAKVVRVENGETWACKIKNNKVVFNRVGF